MPLEASCASVGGWLSLPLRRRWQLWTQIILLALLLAYLFIKERQRTRRPIRERQWPGKAIELSGLQSRIHRVREDFVAATRARPQKNSSREKVAASIRQTIQRLSCFRRKQTDNSGDVTHEASKAQG